MVRRMTKLTKGKNENTASFMARHARIYNEALIRYKMLPWDQKILIRIGCWAGHVSRMVSQNNRFAHLALRWRDFGWLQRQKAALGTQGHDRRFKPWRWEAMFTRFFETTFPGRSWHDLAECKDYWNREIVPVWREWFTNRRQQLQTGVGLGEGGKRL